MIGRLRGSLVAKQPPWLLVDVSGVGYEVQAPMSTIFDLPEVGKEVTLLTHYAVKEDTAAIYGFLRESERVLFRALQKVSGIGAKTSLAVLSGVSVDEFARLVQIGRHRLAHARAGHRQENRRTHRGRTARSRRWSGDDGAGFQRKSGAARCGHRSDGRAAAARLQTGGVCASGERCRASRRRRRSDHPQSAQGCVEITMDASNRDIHRSRKAMTRFALGALGVVYGDIGTSPLYTMKETFGPQGIARLDGQRARHSFAGVLVADSRGVGEIRRLHHARRQQGRRRHHGADRTRATQRARRHARTLVDRHARPVRRVAVFRRWRDHAGDDGAVGRRRRQGRSAAVVALGRADRRGHHSAALRIPESRHGQSRRGVRTDHDAVVRHARGARHHPDRALSGSAEGAVAVLWRQLLRTERHDGVFRTGFCRAVHHRRRGAVCGHGPFRRDAHPLVVVRLRAAGTGAQLLRAGRVADRKSVGRIESVLSSGAGCAACIR